MRHIDLSKESVKELCQGYSRLSEIPEFSICNDTDVRILLFKRTDKYSGIRTGSKTDFKSCEEFLLYSFLIEELPAFAKSIFSIGELKAEECSKEGLNNIYDAVRINEEYYPKQSDVKRAYLVVNNSELNWAFLEEESKYHSVFWSESESNLFKRSA